MCVCVCVCMSDNTYIVSFAEYSICDHREWERSNVILAAMQNFSVCQKKEEEELSIDRLLI